ncbi:MAG: hypothetical protein AAF088_13070 [Pseudomonadota bacterium]
MITRDLISCGAFAVDQKADNLDLLRFPFRQLPAALFGEMKRFLRTAPFPNKLPITRQYEVREGKIFVFFDCQLQRGLNANLGTKKPV